MSKIHVKEIHSAAKQRYTTRLNHSNKNDCYITGSQILTKAQNTRRKPAQERSRKRVDAILQAAKELIAEKGSARLKIHDIASRADVTPASIYQYFPNKNAITHALAQSVFEHAENEITDTLPTLDGKSEMYAALQDIVEHNYQMYLKDPAMLDVWFSISTDKSIQDLDLEDSRRNSELIFECIKQFYEEKHWARISSVSFLLAHLSGSAVRMALTVGPEEGRGLIDTFKELITPTFMDMMIASEGLKLG